MEKSHWSHGVTLRSEARSASRARGFVRDTLVLHELPAMVDDIRLVVSELAAVVIANRGDDSLTVTIRRAGKAVVLILREGSVSEEVEMLVSDFDTDFDNPLFASTRGLSDGHGVENFMYNGGPAVCASVVPTLYRQTQHSAEAPIRTCADSAIKTAHRKAARPGGTPRPGLPQGSAADS